ncbi:hypothetical protein V1514DRAFT_326348 [Lipomyces japonicus]|uniref:uncharacterized protein n=1 Tax=Lipomyces japonicus TaxID=56871 RepID=UPI0034CE2FE6
MSEFPISVFPAADASLISHDMPSSTSQPISEANLTAILSTIMQASDEPVRDRRTRTIRNLDDNDEEKQEEEELEQQVNSYAFAKREADEDHDDADDEAGSTSGSFVSYSSSTASSSTQANDRDDHDYDDIEPDDQDPVAHVQQSIQNFYNVIKSFDLRADSTYSRAIGPAHGSWYKIAYITIRDQVVVQFVQGFGLKLLGILIAPWFASLRRNGTVLGNSLRRLSTNIVIRAASIFKR